MACAGCMRGTPVDPASPEGVASLVERRLRSSGLKRAAPARPRRERCRHGGPTVDDADALVRFASAAIDDEVGQPIENLFEDDAKLHAGEVRAQTAVQPETERLVPVGEPVENDFVRILEFFRVLVGGGEAEQHPITRYKLVSTDIDRLA